MLSRKKLLARGKLIPTPSGELIADFLTDHFTQIVDYDFTANVETEFDKIAGANLEKAQCCTDFTHLSIN